jgi:hypothetical protein
MSDINIKEKKKMGILAKIIIFIIAVPFVIMFLKDMTG